LKAHNIPAAERYSKGRALINLLSLKDETIANVLSVKNFEDVIGNLYDERKRKFNTPAELRGFVEGVAKKVNEGITKEGVLIREHDSEKYPYPAVENLEQEMDAFYKEFLARLQNNESSKELAAWVEYRVDLSDHFFADGCGKTAKAIGSWILMRTGDTLPKYRERTELYAHAPTKIRGVNSEEDSRALEFWTEYFKSLFTT